MTSTVNASTTSGVIVTSDTSGSLALQTANTTALTINTSQNVGIGITPSANQFGNNLQVNQTILNDDNGGTNHLSKNAYYNSGWKYITTDYASKYTQSLGVHSWSTAPSGTAGNTVTWTQAMTLSASGNLTLGTSNAGIIFNNSSALTNSTLNDYETGTWTPTVTSVSGTLTSYTSNGTYIKIGKFVFVWFQFNITSAGSASGYAIVSSLPFSTTANNGSKALGNVREDNVTGTFYGSYVGASATQILISQFSSYSLGITWTNGFGYNGTLVYQATF